MVCSDSQLQTGTQQSGRALTAVLACRGKEVTPNTIMKMNRFALARCLLAL